MEDITNYFIYAMMAIIGFFGKDLFSRVQRTGDLKNDIESLKTRVIALELSHKEYTEMSKAVVRLEEQVKRLSEDIKYLLQFLRNQSTHDKADAP